MASVVGAFRAIKSEHGWWVPYVWDSRYDLVKSEWMAVTAALALWLLLLILRHAVTTYQHFTRPAVVESADGEGAPLLADGVGAQAASSSLTENFGRAARVARTAFVMLLAATTFTTLPVAFKCTISHVPTTECGTCLGVGATTATSILNWVFFGLSVVWAIMEACSIEVLASHATRLIFAATTFPLIVVTFMIGFLQWNHIMHLNERACDS